MSISATVASSALISSVETVVTAPAAITPGVGSAYKVTLVGTIKSDVEVKPTFNLRMGTTGTVTDALVASVSPWVSDFNNNQAFKVEFMATVQTAAVAGLVDAFALVEGNGNGGVIGITEVNPAPAVINTTAATALEVSAVGAPQIVDVAAIVTGSPWVTLTSSNPLALGDLGNIGVGNPVSFATTVGNFAAGTVYYTVATNAGQASATAMVQLSATRGGAPIVATATGSSNMTLFFECYITVNQAVVQLM